MQTITYEHAQFPVREDFAASHNRFWDRLARPGNWLTGAQRVAVAQEVRHARHCALCLQRKQALSPNHIEGAHDVASDLPDTMVEVIHRVVTDSARLTKAWCHGVLQQGLSEEEYVEIIGTVVAVFSIDEFCRALSLPLNSLPEPQEGEPSRYRPALASRDEAWVAWLPNSGAVGTEADLWQGRTGAVIRALSLVPDEVRTLLDLLTAHYLDNDTIWDMRQRPKGTLSRIQTEVVASRVSAFNGCFY